MNRKRVIGTVSAVFLAVLTLSIMSFAQNNAGEKAINWYCKNNKEHKQPQFSSDLSFVEDYGGVYIDKNHGDTSEEKVIYLTFDAGYENGNIEKILDVMAKEGVTGAFFVLSNLIETNTELVKRMAQEGHLVCNHTMNHKDMTGWEREAFEAELRGLEQLYKEKTGYEMAKFYRPPEGKFTKTSLEYAKELGYTTVFWSFAYADWDNSKQMSCEKAKEKVLEHTHNGEIILLHPTSATNAQILGDLIKAWKEQGYRFGSLEELVK